MQQDKDSIDINRYLNYSGPDQVVTSFELDDILAQSSDQALCVKSKMPTLDRLLEQYQAPGNQEKPSLRNPLPWVFFLLRAFGFHTSLP